MTDEVFTEPEESSDQWVDVRMTDPEEGEWDVDLVVLDGQVEYVDLRVRPELLAAFVDCLVDDVGGSLASTVLANLAERDDVDVPDGIADE